MTDTAEPKNGPDVIYLESEADKYGSEGRLWCEDDDPSGSGYPWIRYVRHDLVTAKDAEIAALKEKVKRQAEALSWYALHVGNCRKVMGEGDASRNELAKDCGERARRAAQEASE